MTLLALGLYLLALILAFGLRSLVQWRRTGDTGLRFDAGPAGSVRWWAKLSFIAALVLGLAGPVAAHAGLDPIDVSDRPAVGVVGLVLAGVGVAATLLAQLNMGTSWRVGVDPAERTALVTAGAFGLVRNPIFTTMILTSCGLALAAPNAVSLVATAVLIISIQVQVRAVEEPYLRRTHGPAYTAYAARVGRFVPGLGTTQPTEPATTPQPGS
jgi:protein-S-isoprenylcysteine O-methyltransferase Ste14